MALYFNDGTEARTQGCSAAASRRRLIQASSASVPVGSWLAGLRVSAGAVLGSITIGTTGTASNVTATAVSFTTTVTSPSTAQPSTTVAAPGQSSSAPAAKAAAAVVATAAVASITSPAANPFPAALPATAATATAAVAATTITAPRHTSPADIVTSPPAATTTNHIFSTFASLRNTYAATTILQWGAAVPIAAGPSGEPVISVARYGRGRLSVFGAQRMVSECCRAYLKRPPLDMLILKIAAWSAGNQTYGKKATLCVSDPMFKQLPRHLERRFGNKYNSEKQAGLRSLVVPVADFMDFGHLKCDVYVVGSYEELYNDPYTQDRLVGYVANGKALMVVGPDVMPSIFYAPHAPSAVSRRMLWEGNDKAGDDGRLAAAGGQYATAGAVSLMDNQQQQQWMVVYPRRLA
ncbi:hypothetical protein PLESTF_000918800 [Pleodorina starrii]|nr:hypothetical protein PLESTF_000918800 [Pleodorina starrii]